MWTATALVLLTACGRGTSVAVAVTGQPAGDDSAHVSATQDAGTYACTVKAIDEEGDVLGSDTFIVELPKNESVVHRGKVTEIGSDLPDHFDGTCSKA